MSSPKDVPYDGHVVPDGPTAVHRLADLVIRKASVSAMDNNVYLLTCARTGEQLLIDAADDAARIDRLVHEGTGRLDTVVTTHRHWDHVRALEDVAHATGARTCAGEDDADALPLAPDVRLRHGDQVTVGEVTLEVLHLRGHTPGGVALAYREPDGRTHLFTGDSLFPGGVGATDRYDYQSFDQLIDDVEYRVLDRFEDSTWFYPGHGDDGVLGEQRGQLPTWRERGW